MYTFLKGNLLDFGVRTRAPKYRVFKSQNSLQVKVHGKTGKLLGIADPGFTRWTSRYDQLKKQQELKDYLKDLLLDDEWAQYISRDNSDIIGDIMHWRGVKSSAW